MVINTYEIQQITSYFIGLVNINLVVVSMWLLRPMHICMLLVSRWWWYAKFACYRYWIEITLIASRFFPFLLPLILSIHVDIFLVFVISNIAVFIWNSDSRIIANKHDVCLLYNTCPILPSLHKTFQQIYLILNSIDFIVYIIFHTIFHTVTLIYSGGKFNTHK